MDPCESSGGTIAETALLVTCLRGFPFLIPHDIDWATLLKLAQAHGVLLPLNAIFIASGIEVPDYFLNAVREHTHKAARYADELECLLREFGQKEIAAISLKGPAMAEILYGNATMRSCDDLDLLVRREDFSKAEQALTQIGFVARRIADDYHRKFLRGDLLVELHFAFASPRSFPFDISGVWKRAREGSFRTAPLLVMSNEDLALFLCVHGLKHGFSRLIWIMDVARALGKLPHQSAARLAEVAHRQGLKFALMTACEMVRETLPGQLPVEIEAMIAKSPELAERARSAVAKVFAESPGTTNDADIWRFYLQMESSARQRWRRRLSFLVPTAEDYAWAERHHIHSSIAPVCRPFRLLHKYGPGKVWRILFPPSA